MKRLGPIWAGLRRVSWRLALGLLALVLGLTSGIAPAMADGHECGGINLVPPDAADPNALGVQGMVAARMIADEHNLALNGRYRLARFRPRDAQNGRAQVEKEVCSRLDLERDLLGLWRVAAVVGAGLFILSLSWGGVMLMGEYVGIGQPGRARSIMMSGLVGIVVVAAGFYLWHSALISSFGFFSLEIGEVNPIGGVSPHGD